MLPYCDLKAGGKCVKTHAKLVGARAYDRDQIPKHCLLRDKQEMSAVGDVFSQAKEALLRTDLAQLQEISHRRVGHRAARHYP
jgi:hypothetical protein